MKVPFNDLTYQNDLVKPEITGYVKECLEKSEYIGGAWLEEFEKDFAAYCGVTQCIGTGNCTDALELILEGLDIGKDDEVIVPAYSWVSTAAIIARRGATPVFIDIHPDYYTLNADLLEAKITAKTKAIIVVHFYGQMADMKRICEIADSHKIFVIEDCAQASGAIFNKQKTGSFGIAGAFSFYPTKNLGALGDGGCVTTNNEDLAIKIRMLANHGQQRKNQHVILGRNSRLDTFQAKVLSKKLKFLDEWNLLRINGANAYSDLLKDSGIKTPLIRDEARHVFHLYVIQVDNRAQIITFLSNHGIQTAIHYPTPITSLKPFEGFLDDSDFPVANDISKRILSLPLFPGITKAQIEYCADFLLKAVRSF